jgi:predicted nucleic acid-binding protein
MIVVSDTGPLRYLSVLGCTTLLPQLFGKVCCPCAIIQECRHPKAPAELQALIAAQPDWIVSCEPLQVDPTLADHLDPGEAAAISLAEELNADLVLIDEKKGRQQAKLRGLAVAGTLNIIALAARRGLLDYHTTVSRLRTTTNFRVSDAVVIAAYGESE